ncbi:hypothetical protein ACFYYB_22510 [Streptomyces sp. NPDC002886]
MSVLSTVDHRIDYTDPQLVRLGDGAGIDPVMGFLGGTVIP